MANKPPRKRMKAADRRAHIVSAARDAFVENGEPRTRTRDIADRAGITEPFLYRFFSSKQEMYEAAILEPLDELVTALEQRTKEMAAEGKGFTEKQLAQIHVELLGFMEQAMPFFVTAIFSDIGDGKNLYQTSVYPRLRDAVVNVLDALSGGRMGKFDPDTIYNMTIGVHLGVALDHALRGIPLDVEESAAEIARLYAAGRPRR